MSVTPGQASPDFTRRSDDGRTVSLAQLRGRWVVLYFYPRASSAGCSIEAQRFEAALPEFERLGAQVIGVSTDTEARQAAFRDRCTLSYPLLSDGDHSLSRAYGVLGTLGGLLNMASRVTFLIDPDGAVAWVHRSGNPLTHVSSTLAELERRAASAAGRTGPAVQDAADRAGH
ncbi:peroxiredoxin [Deinococcus radiotolerans]|uniref:thioredoxin-dependent peroxiredoxin n=1 Tax=Deinococcus radiotolerans TaxID=1309407 RepID=A0ABQ2FPE1_9DEIO|nr:peroxiredoxin [Deinococcus radiotolerans]GGL13516.1 peroxiredoxin [Deinococcus radiotolerans]